MMGSNIANTFGIPTSIAAEKAGRLTLPSATAELESLVN